jgi:hypothetical protein
MAYMNRDQKIQALVNNDYRALERGDWELVDIFDILENGFKGYANFTDKEIDELIDLYEIED